MPIPPLLRLVLLPKTLLALLLAGMIVGACGWHCQTGTRAAWPSAIAIIAITTLGVGGVLLCRRCGILPNSYPLGMYLILIFCFYHRQHDRYQYSHPA